MGTGPSVLIVGRGSARVLFLANGSPSQCVAPFRVRRTNIGQPLPPRLQPTRFLGIVAADELGDGTFGRVFLGAAVPAAYF